MNENGQPSAQPVGAGENPIHPTRRTLRLEESPQREKVSRPDRVTLVRGSRRFVIAKRRTRMVVTLTLVSGLISAFALPAYAVPPPGFETQAPTLQQIASADTQSLVVASDVSAAPLSRGSFSATTPEEIERKKAIEAAAARARANAQSASSPRFDFSMVTPGSGEVRWPLGGPFTVGDRFGARGGAHMGTDMLAAGGTPVFAALDGVVKISQDSYSAYGVTVVLESIVNGQRVGTVYPHMRIGSRQVSVGQEVSAGQVIGAVGSTGRSTANHLHFEVYIDGTAIDSLSWLQATAG